MEPLLIDELRAKLSSYVTVPEYDSTSNQTMQRTAEEIRNYKLESRKLKAKLALATPASLLRSGCGQVSGCSACYAPC